MNTKYLVIDGYCLMHRDPSLVHLIQENLMLARQRLVRDVAASGDAFADDITIVFDGRTGSGEGFEGSGVTVLFSAPGESADTVIERMIAQSEEAADYTVVTSDRAIIDIVTAAGARIVSCGMFLEYRKEGEHRARRQIRRSTGKAPNQLGDYFPD
jgi:predicted RNA-binding protein with PIN domain